MEKDIASTLMYKDWAVMTYLLFVVGTTIFSNKAKNYVDLTYTIRNIIFRSDIQIVDKNIHIATTNLHCCYKFVFSQQLYYRWEKLLIPTIIIVAANSIIFLQQPCKVAGKSHNYYFFMDIFYRSFYSYFYA
jgi:hypothetical protein